MSSTAPKLVPNIKEKGNNEIEQKALEFGGFALVECSCCPAIKCIQQSTEQIEYCSFHRVKGHVVEGDQSQHDTAVAWGKGRRA